jgi:hypothetical protein
MVSFWCRGRDWRLGASAPAWIVSVLAGSARRSAILTGMANGQFLEMAGNLARYHREHEKFYARAPLEEAAALQRISAALRALAERWSGAEPGKPEVASPYSGAEDLNDERAIELAGILFMEGEGEPAEIARIKAELRSASEDNAQAGEWLGKAMEASWAVAEALLRFPELADLISERHRIISNDWQAASLMSILARSLGRALAILEALDFAPAAIRADLEGDKAYPDLLHSACDLIDHASDLAAQSAALVHANERRWRVFRERVERLAASGG